MKSFLLLAFVIGTAICVPQMMFMEFDMHHAPAQALQAVPAGAGPASLEVLLPVDAAQQPARAPTRGFIKQEIPQPLGRESIEIFHPFGFAQAAPAAPVAPAAPAAPAPRRKSDDDEEDDE
ncbi:secretory calcium-binding phosphoprotein 7 [Hypomesus transpacificus]|uniref:secretory calcium-binding phosphoprotein 7 n=1 Tax=Hypomesus transpacificus TaxID=137520 RepID=UPI001F07A992|nr:secretory calcium-binding phosphoprotein 7 [Hypomesus transpacificus]